MSTWDEAKHKRLPAGGHGGGEFTGKVPGVGGKGLRPALTAKGPPGVVAPDVGRVTAKVSTSQDTIRLGIFTANRDGKSQYIYQTHNGWAVDASPPPAGQGHFRADPDGRVFRITHDFQAGKDTEKHAGTYRVVKKSAANGNSGLEKVTGTASRHTVYVERTREICRAAGLPI